MPRPSASDCELLNTYCSSSSDSEAAFTELVRRHVDTVYSSALRRLHGNAASAADVTQRVFTELAHKAPSVKRHPVLIAWLFTTTRHMASQTLRDESRRQRREQEASAVGTAEHPSSEPDWRTISPLLDAALDALSEEDRRILLLRHLDRQAFGAIGTRLGLKENTVRMRSDRALEKLRGHLSRRGVTSTAAAIAIVLDGPAIAAAPVGLAASISASALCATAPPIGLLTLMSSTTLKTSVLAIAFAALGTAILLEHHEIRRLREINASLLEQAVVDQESLSELRNRVAKRTIAEATVPPVQTELLRLRGQIAHLLREKSRSSPTNTVAVSKGAHVTPWNALEGLSDRGTATPEDASVSFLASLRAQNQERFIQLVQLPADLDSSSRSNQLTSLYQLFRQRYANWEFTGLTGEQVEAASGANGEIESGKVDLEYVDISTGKSGVIRVHLRKTDKEWRVAIDDFPRDRTPETTGP